jgi:hypothetical protein
MRKEDNEHLRSAQLKKAEDRYEERGQSTLSHSRSFDNKKTAMRKLDNENSCTRGRVEGIPLISVPS